MDDKITLMDLKNKVNDFCESRDWRKFHDAKELSSAMALEVAELMEPFRYKSKEEVREIIEDKVKREEIEDELADILFLVLRFSDIYGISLVEIFDRKIKKSDAKYPVEKVKGLNKKYDEY